MNCFKGLAHNRRYVLIFILLAAIGVIVIIWLLINFVYTLNQARFSLEERLAFASLWVEIIGFALAVVGAFLAVLQFQAAQRRPDLLLWIGSKGQQEVALHSPNELFAFILENRGTGVARFVKINVVFRMPPYVERPINRPDRVSIVKVASEAGEYWDVVKLLDHVQARFDGGNRYICYDRDLDDFRMFRIDWDSTEKLESVYTVEYELRCEGMNRRTGKLGIKLTHKP